MSHWIRVQPHTRAQVWLAVRGELRPCEPFRTTVPLNCKSKSLNFTLPTCLTIILPQRSTFHSAPWFLVPSNLLRNITPPPCHLLPSHLGLCAGSLPTPAQPDLADSSRSACAGGAQHFEFVGVHSSYLVCLLHRYIYTKQLPCVTPDVPRRCVIEFDKTCPRVQCGAWVRPLCTVAVVCAWLWDVAALMERLRLLAVFWNRCCDDGQR